MTCSLSSTPIPRSLFLPRSNSTSTAIGAGRLCGGGPCYSPRGAAARLSFLLLAATCLPPNALPLSEMGAHVSDHLSFSGDACRLIFPVDMLQMRFVIVAGRLFSMLRPCGCVFCPIFVQKHGVVLGLLICYEIYWQMCQLSGFSYFATRFSYFEVSTSNVAWCILKCFYN